ncbi:hypothetical protein [Roseibium sp.]|uniref:hypothetical protein n=1 Tax=Roseibium sp. TaxID=1936156 RepID=UPI0032643850
MTARNMIEITKENSCKTGAVHKWQSQQRQSGGNQCVNLPIGACPTQHGDDREQNHADLAVHFALSALTVGNCGKAGHKIDGWGHGEQLS